MLRDTGPGEVCPTDHSEITIVFIGKTGSGKTTLRDNLLDEQNSEPKPAIVMTPNPATQSNNFKTTQQHYVTLKIYDTVGLQPGEGNHLLKKLSDDTKGQADLVILCVPVSPSNKFIDRTPDIMRELQGVFGKDIWRRCIIALTFSNLAWDRCEKKSPAPVDAYKEYITAYKMEIQQEFHKLGVRDVVVTTPFSPQPAEEGKFQVVAVPVGDDLDDEVLPEIQLNEKEKWRGFFFLQMLENCPKEKQENLLNYRYGPFPVEQILTSMGIDAAAVSAMGVIAGGLKGAAVGAPLGPAGVVAGAIVGTAVGGGAGAVAGALHGGLTTGAVLAVVATLNLKQKKTFLKVE